MAGILIDDVDAAAHKITDAQRLPLALMNSGMDLIPESPGRKSFNNLIGLHKITTKNFQQTQGSRQVRNSGIFSQCHRPGGHMQPPGIGQKLVK